MMGIENFLRGLLSLPARVPAQSRSVILSNWKKLLRDQTIRRIRGGAGCRGRASRPRRMISSTRRRRFARMHGTLFVCDRSADRTQALHGKDVRLRALEPGAGYRHAREIAQRRLCARGRDRDAPRNPPENFQHDGPLRRPFLHLPGATKHSPWPAALPRST